MQSRCVCGFGCPSDAVERHLHISETNRVLSWFSFDPVFPFSDFRPKSPMHKQCRSHWKEGKITTTYAIQHQCGMSKKEWTERADQTAGGEGFQASFSPHR